MAKSPKKRKKKEPVPSVSPLPPPGACDLSAICGQVQAFFDTIANAPSGSLLSVEDGALVVIPPPSPLTEDKIPVLDHTTGEWALATR